MEPEYTVLVPIAKHRMVETTITFASKKIHGEYEWHRWNFHVVRINPGTSRFCERETDGVDKTRNCRAERAIREPIDGCTVRE